jgi:hypothetical protein
MWPINQNAPGKCRDERLAESFGAVDIDVEHSVVPSLSSGKAAFADVIQHFCHFHCFGHH